MREMRLEHIIYWPWKVATVVTPGTAFNIAGDEAFKLTEVVDVVLELSTRNDITIETSEQDFVR